MLRIAKETVENLGLKNLKFIRCDAHNPPFKDNTFDLVVGSNTPLGIEDAMYKVLKPGKKITVSNHLVSKPIAIIIGTRSREEYVEMMRQLEFKKIETRLKRLAGILTAHKG